ncbi:hypothetical protein ACQKFK_22155, partial [Bacillus mycoides]
NSILSHLYYLRKNNVFLYLGVVKRLKLMGMGDGQQIRCFSYISDIVNGTILAFEYEGENFADFNIGNNKPISMEELAGKINELMGNKSEIEFLNLGDEGVRDSNIEIFRRIPSIEKAQLLLNYQPVISLNKGLEIIIEEKYGNTVSIS